MSQINRRVFSWILASSSLFALANGCSKGGETNNAKPPVTVTVLERIPKGAPLKKKANAPVGPAVVVGSPEDLARRYQVPVTISQPTLGPSDAFVTVTTWCDFKSKMCRQLDADMKELMKTFDGKLRWAFRNLPATQMDSGEHLFAMTANRRAKKFWEVREALLKFPSDHAISDTDMQGIASDLKIEAEVFGQPHERINAYVQADERFATMFGVERPMGVFVNGRRLPAVSEPDALKPALLSLIKEELNSVQKLVKSGELEKNGRLYDNLTKDAYWSIADNDEARARRAAEIAEKQAKMAEKIPGLAGGLHKAADTVPVGEAAKAKSTKSAKEPK